ncbi:MAG TPA: M56 family metallopeptidase [Humisphaera sp.]|jgi:beta-lactamase regulating signal transducer with metallopeptidase domain|nr:M56 family metallopeptidase [Humisphaera sp.]
MRELLTLAAQNSLGAAILALLAIVASLFLRRPALTHILWVLVLVKLITPPIWAIPVTIGLEKPVTASTVAAPRIEAAQDPALRSYVAIDSIERTAPPVISPIVQAQKPQRVNWENASVAAVSLWICGSIVFATIALIRLRRFSKLLRFAVDVPPDVRNRADGLARSLALRGAPTVAFIAAPISPMLLGFPLPVRLLIPRRLWDQLTDSQRDALLLHELAHYRRRDHWVRGLELLVTLIHWWNPLTWLARRQLRIAEELCCDAWVTWALPQYADDYAAALVDAIDFAASRSSLPLLASGVGDFKHLQRRLLMIRSRQGNRKMGWTALIACAAIVALPLSLTRAKQAVSPDSTAGNPPSVTIATQPNRPADPEEYTIFRGIQVEDGKPIVVIEDSRDRSNVRLRAGSIVRATGGKIVDAAPDAEGSYELQYARPSGEVVRVKLGSALSSGEVRKAPHAGPSADDLKTLDRVIRQVKFSGAKLRDAINFLGNSAAVGIDVDWDALQIANVDSNTPVTLSLKKITLRQALDLTLKSVRDDQPALRAVMEHGAITVTTQGHLHMNQRAADAVLLVGPLEPDHQTVAALGRVLPEISFDRTPFGDVVDFLCDVSGLNFVVDWHSLKGGGIDRNSPVSIKIQNSIMSRGLEMILANVDKGEKLRYSIDGRIIVIARVDQREFTVLRLDGRKSMEAGDYANALKAVDKLLAIYPEDEWAKGVRPRLQDEVNLQNQRAALERRFSSTTQAAAPHPADAVTRMQRELEISNKLEKDWPQMHFNHEHLSDVLNLISRDINVEIVVDWEVLRKAGISPDTDIEFATAGPVSYFLKTVLSFAGAGKTKLAYRIDPERGVIVIAIASEPATRPAANSPPLADEADRRVEAQLDKILLELGFDQRAFTDVIDSLQRVTGLPIVVEWKALDAAKIDPKTPVTLKAHHIKMSKAIDWILAGIGGDPPTLGYVIRDGALVISTQNELAKDTLNRIYDVRDLINDANGKPDEQLKAKLIQEIRSSIDRTSWIDNGGHVGALRELSGQLIITQTRENQRKIMDFLEARRAELRAAGRGPATQQAFPLLNPRSGVLPGINPTDQGK